MPWGILLRFDTFLRRTETFRTVVLYIEIPDVFYVMILQENPKVLRTFYPA